MCGIIGVFNLRSDGHSIRSQVLSMSRKLRHRGPDWSGIYCGATSVIAHERLAIVDVESGRQPLFSEDGNLVLGVNGEIYNHRELRKETPEYNFLTRSDCEIILALYKKFGIDFLEMLNGIFAFALYDSGNNSYFIARDHIGIIPLYMGWDEHGQFYVASELKALEGVCKKIEEFPPGHCIYSPDSEAPVRWYDRKWKEFEEVKSNSSDISKLRSSLENAVHRQLMSDVPYGVLLSGGLDSSIISAIAAR